MYKTIKKWKMPDSYFGATWPEYYEVIGQHRDSDSVSRSNFRSLLEKIGGESETVIINRCGHWAVGWVETIVIHESDLVTLKLVDEIMTKLERYPVISDDDLSELEMDDYSSYAESEKASLTKFLEEVFTVPLEYREDTLELAFELNMESQYQGGEYSAFNFNIYNYRETGDFDISELESLLDDIQDNHSEYWNKNSAMQYLRAVLNLDQGGI